MQFVYQPEGAVAKSWAFEPGKMANAEAEAIERLTKMTFAEWGSAVRKGSVLALHGLLYVLLKRDIPTLTYDQVVFTLSEVDFQLDDDEAAQTLAYLEAQAEEKAKDGDVLDFDDAVLLDRLRANAPEPTPVADDEAPDEAPRADPND